MSYRSIMSMAGNPSLLARIAAAAAEQGIPEHPVQWAQQNIWNIVAAPGWDEAWDFAENSKTVNQNPDTGLRDDVITDEMILAVVQPLVAKIVTEPATMSQRRQ